MLHEIKNAVIKDVANIQYGTTKSGSPFSRATVVFEVQDGQYINSYAIEAFGDDKIRKAKENIGREADVKFDIRSREYNGRWYSDIRIIFLTIDEGQQPKAPAPAPAPAAPEQGGADDLPF